MLKAGNFSKDRPLIIGSSHTEGTLFVPQANTTYDMNAFLQTQFPDINNQDLADANTLYSSVPRTYPYVKAAESPLFHRLSQIYGDMAFSCPVLEFATQLSSAGVPVYLFRTHILDTVEVVAGYIVPHTWELQAVWGPEYSTNFVALPGARSYSVGEANRPSVMEVQKYWLSFASTSGHPNMFREENSPVWHDFSSGKRLVLQTNATRMEEIPLEEFDRCTFWSGVSSRTHL
jgi:acetylcholinesterase